MTLSLFCCAHAPVAPVRQSPDHRAEQISQLLFGEKAQVLEAQGNWTRIRAAWDGYEGWCPTAQLSPISKRDFNSASRCLLTNHQGRLLVDGQEVWLPAGAETQLLKKLTWPGHAGRIKGKKEQLPEIVFSPEKLVAAAHLYLHVPYLWGGRTLAGIDCSGLVQNAYKLCGVPIPRDAWQQALTGDEIHFLSEARPGDLAFFDNEEGRIVHVGMMLDQQNILHATETTGRTVIDRIDGGGIISIQLRKRTHRLRIIRRIEQPVAAALQLKMAET